MLGGLPQDHFARVQRELADEMTSRGGPIEALAPHHFTLGIVGNQQLRPGLLAGGSAAGGPHRRDRLRARKESRAIREDADRSPAGGSAPAAERGGPRGPLPGALGARRDHREQPREGAQGQAGGQAPAPDWGAQNDRTGSNRVQAEQPRLRAPRVLRFGPRRLRHDVRVHVASRLRAAQVGRQHGPSPGLPDRAGESQGFDEGGGAQGSPHDAASRARASGRGRRRTRRCSRRSSPRSR